MDTLDFPSFFIVNTLIITTSFLSVYYVIKLNENQGILTIYERNQYLIIIANLINCVESVISITFAYFFTESNLYCKVYKKMTTLTGLNCYFTRAYSACILVRLYRVFLLNKYRKGLISKETLQYRSSLKWILSSINIYSIGATVLLIIFIFTLDESTLCTVGWFYNGLLYIFETLALSVISIVVFKSHIHPSMKMEYLFYSIIWSISVIQVQSYDADTYKRRWAFEIPIRNFALLLISIASIYEHDQLIRPPLPFNICISDVFEIEELYYNFKEYVQEINDIKYIKACDLYHEFCLSQFQQKYSKFRESCRASHIFSDTLRDELEKGNFEEIKDHLENVLNDVLFIYLNSRHFETFRMQYNIKYC